MTAATKTRPAIAVVPDAASEEARRPIRAVNRDTAKLAEQVANSWIVYAMDEHAEPDDYNDKPERWVHMTEVFRMHDRIAVAHRRWIAEGFVVDCGSGYANVLLTHSIAVPPRREGSASDVPEGYAIRQAGPGETPEWIAVRLSDNWQMNRDKDHKTREQCRRWLSDLAIFRDAESPDYTRNR